MSASLVGSEMCIRDSLLDSHTQPRCTFTNASLPDVHSWTGPRALLSWLCKLTSKHMCRSVVRLVHMNLQSQISGA
eukprot:11709619-Alexandrium_andersonii.AAC.1